MNLTARLHRVEKILGKHRGPLSIFLSTASDRHEIRRIGPGTYGMTIPWRPEWRGADPSTEEMLAALTAEQSALARDAAKINVIVIDPAELGSADRFVGL
jgi:hypothetical protein